MNNKDKEKLPLVVAPAKSAQSVKEDDEIERTSDWHWQDEYDWQVNSALPPEDREGGIVRDLLNDLLKFFGL
jgi:hypothetical protein